MWAMELVYLIFKKMIIINVIVKIKIIKLIIIICVILIPILHWKRTILNPNHWFNNNNNIIRVSKLALIKFKLIT
jgi:hypothetical protein